MAKRGPKPTPTKLKVLRGNPGKRRLPKDEPSPIARAKVPSAPKWLPAIGRGEWKRIASQLHKLGLLTLVDETALAAYCEAYSRYRKAVEWMEKNGATIVIRDKDGRAKSVMRAPHVIIAENASAQMLRYADEFGLTPSSRTRLHAPGSTEADPLEDFLAKSKKRTA